MDSGHGIRELLRGAVNEPESLLSPLVLPLLLVRGAADVTLLVACEEVIAFSRCGVLPEAPVSDTVQRLALAYRLTGGGPALDP